MTDSEQATLTHIRRVQELLAGFARDLIERGRVHDASKLVEPEASAFEIYTAKLATCTYGSDEYKSYLAAMKPALDHHYAANAHHPEHWHNGIRDMSLLDIVEMLIDWKAASERHNDGDIRRSIDQNQARFGYSDELKVILQNTAARLADFRERWHCFGCGAGGMQMNFCEQCGAGKDDYKQHIPEGKYFKDDADGGRLVSK